MSNNTRVYREKKDISSEKVKSFWDERAKVDSLNAVLLGNQKDCKHSDMRNEKEFTGRWANNLKDKIKLYHGIDFSENFIESNKKRFKNYDNLNFMVMSVADIDLSKLNKTYDLVIINGVLMYINDNNLNCIFDNLRKINPHYIYIQESISILDYRLTLKDFYSEELETQYNAIYRTKREYEHYFKNILLEYKIKKNDLLLDKETGARKETNAQYWFLEKEEL